ncbi:MAG: hypothetical protein GX558_07940 [Clostridiales bacterium]|nr:hypothetical protein [Clostridiales bacterium]
MFLLEAAATAATNFSGGPSSVGMALQFMGVGVAGVFAVLAIFYGVIKLLIKLAPEKGDD